MVNSTNAIVSTASNAKTAVTNRVNNTVQFAIDTKTACVTKCTNAKNACVNKYTNTRNTCVTAYNNTKDAVVQKYTNIRDNIYAKYTTSKIKTVETYQYWRNRKYTRWEKVKYSCLLVLFFFIFGLALLSGRDIYRGDTERAQERWDAVLLGIARCLQFLATVCLDILDQSWKWTCILLEYSYYGTKTGLQYTVYGFKVGLGYAVHYSYIALQYSWTGLKIVASYLMSSCQVGYEYFIFGASQTCAFIWMVTKLVASYISLGVCAVGQYAMLGCKATGEYVVIGSRAGAEYAVIGARLAGQCTVDASIYAYEHGTVAAKEGSIRAVKYLFYFLTNFRQASFEALVFLFETSLWLGSNLWVGAKEGSVLLWEGTKLTVNGTYHGSIATANGVVYVTTTTYEYTRAATEFTVDTVTYSSNATWHFGMNAYSRTAEGLDTGMRVITEWAVRGASLIYTSTSYMLSTGYESTVAVSSCVFHWTREGVATTGRVLHVALNQYALRWLYSAALLLAHWLTVISLILYDFLSELTLMFANFIVSIVTTVYNVLYVIVGFVYQIVSAVSTIIRAVTGALVFCVHTLFECVIWVLQETLFAYLYMLHKYNMYREIIFAGFVVILSVYCTGLMRDRSQGDDDADFSSDDDAVDSGDLDFELSDKPRAASAAVIVEQALDSSSSDDMTPREVNARHRRVTTRPRQQVTVASRGKQTATVKPLPPAATGQSAVAPAAPPPAYSKRGALPSYDDQLMLSDDSDDEFLLDTIPDVTQFSDDSDELDLVTKPAPPSCKQASQDASVSESLDAVYRDSELDFHEDYATDHSATVPGSDVTPSSTQALTNPDEDEFDFDQQSLSEIGDQQVPEVGVTSQQQHVTSVSQWQTIVSELRHADSTETYDSSQATSVATPSGYGGDTSVGESVPGEGNDVTDESVSFADGAGDTSAVVFECDEFGNPV